MGCIGCIFLYIFFFQFGLGPMPFFIGAGGLYFLKIDPYLTSFFLPIHRIV